MQTVNRQLRHTSNVFEALTEMLHPLERICFFFCSLISFVYNSKSKTVQKISPLEVRPHRRSGGYLRSNRTARYNSTQVHPRSSFGVFTKQTLYDADFQICNITKNYVSILFSNETNMNIYLNIYIMYLCSRWRSLLCICDQSRGQNSAF